VKKLAAKTLEWVGLAQYANQRPLNLSGGQQQRVSVARAIITQPEILLADEPAGNLDEDSAARLMELFLQMNKNFGTAIILATHSTKLMETYKFPKIIIEDHKVRFDTSGVAPHAERSASPRSEPQKKKPDNYFSQLSSDLLKQLDEIRGRE
jgi:cell division transport system ATP-binding protein